VPNLHKNLIPRLRNKPWDPKEKYHAPWQSGLTGIAYNRKNTTEVKSFTELLTRSDLKGRITLLTEMRDTMGFMLRTVGADPEKFTDTQWQNAIDSLHKAVSAGRSGRSTATTTSTTWPPGTHWPARPGRVT
jgi:spermidine/putrescine transport system substrate-binding protein